MSITLRIVDADEIGRAHQWHVEFAKMNHAIFPRTIETFREMVFARSVWAAINSEDQYLGMCYAHFDEDLYEWEIGGLMVGEASRGLGLGSVLMRLSLVSMLFNEDPLAWRRRPGIVSHVLAGNDSPRRIIPAIGFTHARTVRIPGHVLPGLPVDDEGFVNGDEFCLSIPDGLIALARWCEDWDDRVRDGTPTSIDMLSGTTLKTWATALRGMAERVQGKSG